MIKLEISPLDQKDIIELLDYAKEQKNLNKPILKGSHKWDDTKYWDYRIEYLKQVMQGKIFKASIYRSSMTYYDTKKEENYDSNY